MSLLNISNPFGPTSKSKLDQATARAQKSQADFNNSAIHSIKNPVELGHDFAEGFYIVEIVNGKEQDPDSVTLVGNMMPKQPFPFGGEQKIVKEYYPGNSEPAVHVLGPRETDIVLLGTLKDKRYNPEFRGVSQEIAKQLDAIRIRGNLLRIKLGEFQRYAFLEKTDFKMNKLSWFDYSLTFSIVGFNLPINGKFVDSKVSPVSINKQLIADAVAFVKKGTVLRVDLSKPALQIKAAADQSLIDTLNGAISDVATVIGRATTFVDQVFTAAEDLVKVANRALGLIKNAKAALSKYKRRLGAIQQNLHALGGNPLHAGDAVTRAYIASSFIHNSISNSRVIHSGLSNLEAQIRLIAQSIPIARYRVIKGDTLQKIAQRFYGDSTQWTKISDHNKLSTTVLIPGQILEISR